MSARRTVLVVGVSGLIGRNVAKLLRDTSYPVRGVSRGFGEYGSMGAMGADLNGVDIRFGDISHRYFAIEALRGIEFVVYAAGASGVAASIADPVAARATTVDPWLQVVGQSEAGTRIVLMSSQLLYGPSHGRPFTEDDPTAPVSPYAANLEFMEQEGFRRSRSRALEIIPLRLGNVFGDILSLDHHRSHGLVALMLRDLVMQGEIRLFGGGGQTVNLLHVNDLAGAVHQILGQERFESNCVFNLCGETLAVRAIAESLHTGVGSGRLVSVPWPDGLEGAVANNIELNDARFRRRFGWRPARSVTAELERLADSCARFRS